MQRGSASCAITPESCWAAVPRMAGKLPGAVGLTVSVGRRLTIAASSRRFLARAAAGGRTEAAQDGALTHVSVSGPLPRGQARIRRSQLWSCQRWRHGGRSGEVSKIMPGVFRFLSASALIRKPTVMRGGRQRVTQQHEGVGPSELDLEGPRRFRRGADARRFRIISAKQTPGTKHNGQHRKHQKHRNTSNTPGKSCKPRLLAYVCCCREGRVVPLHVSHFAKLTWGRTLVRCWSCPNISAENPPQQIW